MQTTNYEKQLEELQKKKNAIIAKEKQVKAKLSKEKRAKENHAKMVLGGAVFGVFKDKLPTERKELTLYGIALKKVIQANEGKLSELIDNEYMSLLIEQEEKAQAQPSETYEGESSPAPYQQYGNYGGDGQ